MLRDVLNVEVELVLVLQDEMRRGIDRLKSEHQDAIRQLQYNHESAVQALHGEISVLTAELDDCYGKSEELTESKRKLDGLVQDTQESLDKVYYNHCTVYWSYSEAGFVVLSRQQSS